MIGHALVGEAQASLFCSARCYKHGLMTWTCVRMILYGNSENEPKTE